MYKIIDFPQIKLSSINNKFGLNTKTNRFFAKKEYTNFKDLIYYEVLKYKKLIPVISEKDSIILSIHTKTHLDIDAFEKALIDSISKALGFNDKRIIELHIYKTSCKRTEINSLKCYLELKL